MDGCPVCVVFAIMTTIDMSYLEGKLFYSDPQVTIYNADARKLLPCLDLEAIGLVITDPVWPGCSVDLPGRGNERELLTEVCDLVAPHVGRLIIMLGVDVDPRLLSAVPDTLPFVRVCWLKRIPPKYKGPILLDADVAYVFGHRKLGATPKQRLLPGVGQHVSRGHRDYGNTHPCPRCYDHIKWLVRWFSKPGQVILDPFAGSGLIGRAAKELGRQAVLIDIEEQYCQIAERMCTQEVLNLNGAGNEG